MYSQKEKIISHWFI